MPRRQPTIRTLNPVGSVRKQQCRRGAKIPGSDATISCYRKQKCLRRKSYNHCVSLGTIDDQAWNCQTSSVLTVCFDQLICIYLATNTLFDNAMKVPEISATLATYGYDTTRLTHERTVITIFSRACQDQVAAIGAAMQATHAARKAAYCTFCQE